MFSPKITTYATSQSPVHSSSGASSQAIDNSNLQALSPAKRSFSQIVDESAVSYMPDIANENKHLKPNNSIDEEIASLPNYDYCHGWIEGLKPKPGNEKTIFSNDQHYVFEWSFGCSSVHCKEEYRDLIEDYRDLKNNLQLQQDLLRMGASINDIQESATFTRNGDIIVRIKTKNIGDCVLSGEQRKFPPIQIAKMMQAVCRSISSIHECDVYHGDTDPGNFIVQKDSDGEYKAIAIDLDTAKHKDEVGVGFSQRHDLRQLGSNMRSTLERSDPSNKDPITPLLLALIEKMENVEESVSSGNMDGTPGTISYPDLTIHDVVQELERIIQ